VEGVAETLMVNEVYLSLQGESTFAGLPCIFVRLTACNLRCSYCDTAYAFTEGKRREIDGIHAEILGLAGSYPGAGTAVYPVGAVEGATGRHRLPLVEFTGGEPLLQPRAAGLMARLCDDGFTVLVETSGAHDIGVLDPRIRRIMDLKCPSSGEVARNRWANIGLLRATDEVKFVVGTWEDYEWMVGILAEHEVAGRCPVLVSWVAPLAPEQRDPSLKPVPEGHRPLTRMELADRIIADRLPVRFQLQMHKYVWASDARGV
jgi:7-carboxy-7-deazaguanine synthase